MIFELTNINYDVTSLSLHIYIYERESLLLVMYGDFSV